MSEMVTVVYSKNFEAIRSRIRRLPQLMVNQAEAYAKRDALTLIDNFREGIKGDSFNLKELQGTTIAIKRRAGYPSPATPLYGTNRRKNRYNNMLEVVRVGHRYVVRPRREKHWRSNVRLDVLFDVHEYGATIKNGFGRGTRIRIPPRPAFRYAYNKLLKGRSRRDDAREFRTAVVRYIQSGRAWAQSRIRMKNRET